ncbi:uncharacterized protein LOC131066039 [Cryptomeria japonica]|uniref:uncharacterized protein LOC131066039 n=1 Tax=Cryptomeria japonica TaxID=3369 RepID=UPI0027DA0B14|nr:uncharacterized protein LOC131066039 [Cryptomeria japonica]
MGGESEQEEDDLTFAPLLKRARRVRETLMQSYSEQEVQTFNKLRGFGTGIQKLPQEWKCYINYHKFARNVVAKKTKHASLHPSAWRVEFVAWTFVCSQWKHEVNCLIQDWYSFTDVIDKNGKTKLEPSLKEIVANYIKQRWRPEQSDSIKEKERKEQERWIKLYTALQNVQDVSMEGIQCFQELRFHCAARYLTLPLEYCKSPEFNRSRALAPMFSQLGVLD